MPSSFLTTHLYYYLAKGCRANWFRQSGGTPEVVGSIPGRGEFPPPVKKTPSLVSCPKHCGARPNSQGVGPPCTGGAGVRGFSWSAVRRSFYLSNKKKSPRLPHVQSTVEPGLTHKATGPRVRVGMGSGVFLACCEKVILPLKQCRGGGLTPRRSSFLKAHD